jgi:hypothetical protein
MKLVDASCFSCYSYSYFNLVIPMMVIMLAWHLYIYIYFQSIELAQESCSTLGEEHC